MFQKREIAVFTPLFIPLSGALPSMQQPRKKKFQKFFGILELAGLPDLTHLDPLLDLDRRGDLLARLTSLLAGVGAYRQSPTPHFGLPLRPRLARLESLALL